MIMGLCPMPQPPFTLMQKEAQNIKAIDIFTTKLRHVQATQPKPCHPHANATRGLLTMPNATANALFVQQKSQMPYEIKQLLETMVRLASTNSVNRVFCGRSGVGLCDKQKNTVGIRGVFFGYLFGQAKR